MLTMFLSLGVILALAAYLRFYRLKQRGIVYFDDGLRMSELQYFEDLFQFFKNNFSSIRAKKKLLKDAEPHFKGLFLNDTNPMHIPVYYCVYKMTGDLENSGLITNALFGLFGIVGVFATGTVMFNPMVGLYAALVLTFSMYHLVYCRAIHAEITGGAFFIWAIYFYCLSLHPHGYFTLALSGLCVGFSFCCNTKKFYFPFYIFLYELIWWFSGTGAYQYWLPRTIVLSSSMAAPLMFCESIFMVLKLAGYPHRTFFREMIDRTVQFVPPDFRMPFLSFYIKTIYHMEGLMIPMLIFSGSIFLLVNFSYKAFILLLQIIVPVFFWITRPSKVEDRDQHNDGSGCYVTPSPRCLSDVIYASAIVAGILLSNLSLPFLLLAIAGIMMTGFYKASKLFKMNTGYRKVFNFLKSQGSLKHISFNIFVSTFYAGKENTVAYDHVIYKGEALLEWLEKQPYRWILFVPCVYQTFKSAGIPMIQPIETIVNNYQPVLIEYQGLAHFKPLIYDQQFTFDYKVKLDDTIQLFDLDIVRQDLKNKLAAMQPTGNV